MGDGVSAIVVIVGACALLLAALACGCIGAAMVLARRDAHRRRQRDIAAADHDAQAELAVLVAARPMADHAEVLAHRLRVESDAVDRMRLTVDLAGLGGAHPARLLVAAVRDGVITPTAGAQAVTRTGFDGGLVAGVALHDPDPRVRVFARMLLDGAGRQ